MTTIDAQPSIYYGAAAALHTIASDLSAAVNAKWGALSGCSGMSGSYDEARKWAASYDSQTTLALDAATALAMTMDAYASALRQVGFNHEMADYHATLAAHRGAPPVKPAAPDIPAVTMCRVPPPSAGGPGNGLTDVVGLAEKVGITIPDGDTGKLGTLGDTWAALGAAPAVEGVSDEIGRVINAIRLVRSPEADTALADLTSMQSAAQELAAGFTALAGSCYDHKTALEDLRRQLEKALEDLAKEIAEQEAITLAVGVAASFLTFGVGAVVAVARTAQIVDKCAGPIRAMIDVWKARRLEKEVDTGATLADRAKQMRKLESRLSDDSQTPQAPIRNPRNIKDPAGPGGANVGVISTRPAGWTPQDEAAIKDYTGGGHRELNETLRDGKPLTTDQQARVDAIGTALAKCPSHPGWVVRGTKLPPDVLAEYKEGETITEKGLMSSSRTKEGAFLGGDNNVEMHIFSKSGKDISSISSAGQHEEEVLFGDHTPMRVLKNMAGPGGKTILYLEEQ